MNLRNSLLDRRPRHGWSWLFATMLAAGVCVASADEFAPPTLRECDGPGHASLLVRAASDDVQARAYWVTAGGFRWPGAPADARYALYRSASGQLARRGHRIAGADSRVALEADPAPLPDATALRFKFLGPGAALRLPHAGTAHPGRVLKEQLWLARETSAGQVQAVTSVQSAGALDDLYRAATELDGLGVTVTDEAAHFLLWAPTARAVAVCVFADDDSPARAIESMQFDTATGAWRVSLPGRLDGSYYRYVVEVFVPGIGIVRNRVTDPYSISLGADSRRSYIADLDAQRLKPAGWNPASDASFARSRVAAPTDMVIYELHVRDFSINDPSVPPEQRGKYAAFGIRDTHGMRHLRALSDAGLTDVHLLPVFDLASVPEVDCISPSVPAAGADSLLQQATTTAAAAGDCFNWGYDPFHFNAPEGSYASVASDGAARVLELRAMVQALHRAGLRVGMDVVYNHTSASGQHAQSVLDRIVPGYYHRLDAQGAVEKSTCCENTATEHPMMAKLMIESALVWARHYGIDSFRFDLMGHQPRAVMEALRDRVNRSAGREIQLIGEGWNFGEVADGARFVQASQLSLAGSGIGTFSDRGRDAIRGGGPADKGQSLLARQGYVNGQGYAANAHASAVDTTQLQATADLVRVGLAGTLASYRLAAADGTEQPLSALRYGSQPAGYATQPAEVVNYVENHDNQTLFDINVFKLPVDTSTADRARVQLLAAALTVFSQGIAYFHAGIDTLRSKSLDRNSFDSGDWFNRLDWTYQDNYFGTGLPPARDNGADHALMRPLLRDAGIRPAPGDIAFMREGFRDLLRLRASSSAFRLRTANEVRERLRFHNTGPDQNPLVIAGHLDAAGLPDAGFTALLYLVNVGLTEQTLSLPTLASQRWQLHPVHLAPGAADIRPRRDARHETGSDLFTVPPRTALVYVVK